jgi:diguanylate cyclase (GGDEF)-like protein
VRHKRVTFVYQLRDLQGASRSIVYLTLAGSPYLLAVSILTQQVSAFSFLVSAFLALAGLACWWRPERIPRLVWFAAPLIATATISVLNTASHDASTGAMLFYLWPVLYAANFLSSRVLCLNLAMTFAGGAATAFPILGVRVGLADWAAMVLALAMAATVVHSLRRRTDKLRDVLERQARADHLTGLANRRQFDEALARAGDRVRTGGDTLALLTVDLDHFKAINDTFGHAEGDRVLQAVATALGTVVGPEDLAARLGGDEFVVLLRADRRAALGVAEGLCAAVAARTDLPGGAPGLSVGIAVLPGDVDDVGDLVAASDAALYEAKASGRGRVAMLGPRPQPDLMASSAPGPRP